MQVGAVGRCVHAVEYVATTRVCLKRLAKLSPAAAAAARELAPRREHVLESPDVGLSVLDAGRERHRALVKDQLTHALSVPHVPGPTRDGPATVVSSCGVSCSATRKIRPECPRVRRFSLAICIPLKRRTESTLPKTPCRPRVTASPAPPPPTFRARGPARGGEPCARPHPGHMGCPVCGGEVPPGQRGQRRTYCSTICRKRSELDARLSRKLEPFIGHLGQIASRVEVLALLSASARGGSVTAAKTLLEELRRDPVDDAEGFTAELTAKRFTRDDP
jgi:hypothetical protein